MADQAEGTQPAADAANAEGTQPAADAANAGPGKYTDDDMAAARKSWDKRAARDIEKARAQWERERLEALDIDSWDDLAERLNGKRQAETELEKQLADAKRKAREAGRRAESFDELNAKYQCMVAERNKHAMRTAVYDAAKGAGAHEKLVYAMLVADNRIAVDDDGNVFVRGSDGEPSGLTLDKVIAQLVSEDPALQRPSGTPGAGSLPQTTGARAVSNGGTATDRMRQGVADLVTQQYANLTRR